MTFPRITVDPDLMGGVPTIRGLRIPVATVVSMVADGMSVAEICVDLPDLTPAMSPRAQRDHVRALGRVVGERDHPMWCLEPEPVGREHRRVVHQRGQHAHLASR